MVRTESPLIDIYPPWLHFYAPKTAHVDDLVPKCVSLGHTSFNKSNPISFHDHIIVSSHHILVIITTNEYSSSYAHRLTWHISWCLYHKTAAVEKKWTPSPVRLSFQQRHLRRKEKHTLTCLNSNALTKCPWLTSAILLSVSSAWKGRFNYIRLTQEPCCNHLLV